MIRDDYKAKVLASVDIIQAEDGFHYMFTTTNGGCLGAAELRIIADEMDKRDEPWKSRISELLSEEPAPES